MRQFTRNASMGSFSIRDILNLPEDRIRSLNTKSEDQMSFQDRSCTPRALSSPDDQEPIHAPEMAKSSTNYFSITENFLIYLRVPYSRICIQHSSTVQEISGLKSCLL